VQEDAIENEYVPAAHVGQLESLVVVLAGFEVPEPHG
jgi:hypothetical protein